MILIVIIYLQYTDMILLFISRSKDVLELISKMLSFSDEQKMAIGLGPTSLIASLLGTVVGKPAPPADIEVSWHISLFLYSRFVRAYNY